jgi:hypothetical protein
LGQSEAQWFNFKKIVFFKDETKNTITWLMDTLDAESALQTTE